MFMENRINIAALLKDCPKGMELDCEVFDAKVIYQGLNNRIPTHPIVVQTEHGFEFALTQYGQIHNIVGSKCVIFPKGKTTWEGFVPPCKFKDGDVVAMENECGIHIFIYNYTTNEYNGYGYYVIFTSLGNFKINGLCGGSTYRPATEEEKEKLFNTIKANGYKWNPETKTLEKLIEPNFHEGDWVVNKFGDVWHIDSFDSKNYQVSNGKGNYNYFPISKQDEMHIWTINDAKDGDVVCYKDEISLYKHDIKNCTKQETTFGGFVYRCCYDGKRFIMDSLYSLTEQGKINIHPATKEQRDLLFQKMREAGYRWVAETKTLEKLVIPKFKVGDKVRNKNNHNVVFTITGIGEDSYVCGASLALWFDDQDKYELVPNKFDITTLKPFDEVLVRHTNNGRWRGQFYMSYDKNEEYPFECADNCWKQCIPYENNEHLFDKTDDCADFYKTWE